LKKEQIILQGGGDHARVVLDCLLELGCDVAGIFDPQRTGNLFGISQMGTYDPSSFPEALSVIAIGDNRVRKKVAGNSRHGFIRVIHPSAIVSQRSQVGEGSMVLHRSVIQAQSTIGKHVIINTGAQVDHDCVVGDYAHIAPGVVLCGTVQVGEGTFIGAGAVVTPGIKIGKWCIIGAGAVVIRDLPDYVVAVGNPAKVIKQVVNP
jgi:sugar O-acyltransferase (sialic acid O-acetyltransferase NeuD family)